MGLIPASFGYIVKGLTDEARKTARKYEACFGKGNFFLELQDHGIPQQRRPVKVDGAVHDAVIRDGGTVHAQLLHPRHIFLVSKGFTEGYYYKPRVDMEVLNHYHEGIIALSACLAGEVQRYIVKGLTDEAYFPPPPTHREKAPSSPPRS